MFSSTQVQLKQGRMADSQTNRTDKNHIVLAGGKGVAMVMMDRKDNISKVKNLPEHQRTCKQIPTD